MFESYQANGLSAREQSNLNKICKSIQM